MVGSGPFRFVADERVSGSRVVYARFDGYVPRPDGTPEWTAGPKHVHFDRVEWTVIPDAGTATAAMQRGEMDWWEKLDFDQKPLLANDPKLQVFVVGVDRQLRLPAHERAAPALQQPGDPARAARGCRPGRLHGRRRRATTPPPIAPTSATSRRHAAGERCGHGGA